MSAVGAGSTGGAGGGGGNGGGCITGRATPAGSMYALPSCDPPLGAGVTLDDPPVGSGVILGFGRRREAGLSLQCPA